MAIKYVKRAKSSILFTRETVYYEELTYEIMPESEALALQALKTSTLEDSLPSWNQVAQTVDNISSLAEAKAYLRKLSKVVYYITKNTVN